MQEKPLRESPALLDKAPGGHKPQLCPAKYLQYSYSSSLAQNYSLIPH